MSVIYESHTKLWLNVNQQELRNENISFGQQLLNWMSENELKVAQVNFFTTQKYNFDPNSMFLYLDH